MAKTEEKTGAQSVAMTSMKQLSLTYPTGVTYDTYRAMRSHPTLALARALTVAPIVAGKWSTFASDEASDEAVKFIEDELIPLRAQIMEQALLAGIDFGWQPWEKVFTTKEDGRIHLQKLKPLLQDITTILIDPATGAFAGFEQRGGLVKLDLDSSLLISWRVEGTDWYGYPLLENARLTYVAWTAANDAATRYDTKVAGANFVVHYPVGTTVVDGVETSNFTIAEEILNSLEGSGSVAIPRIPIEYVEKLNAQAGAGWEIEILSDGAPKQYSFNNRMDYFDKNFVRSLLWPERALLEGSHGTKAEASVHAGAALTNMELTDLHVTRFINWYVVDQLLALNFGESARGSVQLQSAPILDEKQEFLRSVFEAVIKDPVGFAGLADRIDMEALIDRLDIPKLDEGSVEEDVEDYKEQLNETIHRLAITA